MIQKYGFFANPNHPLWLRCVNVIRTMPLHQFFALFKRNQVAYHNLCESTKPPTGTERLLWLGLKFCIQKPLPKPALDSHFERLIRSVRIHHLFASQIKSNQITLANGQVINLEEDDDYNPKIYIPNTDFQPKDAPAEVELAILQFKEGLANLISQNHPKRTHNLPRQSRFLLKELGRNRHFIIVPTDKNLGPAIMERSVYKRRCLQDHLLDKKTYRQLSQEDARHTLSAALSKFQDLFETYNETLPQSEAKYLYRALKQNHRIAQFYCIPKVHKTPYKTRPIVSDVGSAMSYLSKFVDTYLQKVVNLCPGYLKDSQSLIEMLNNLGKLPPTAVIIIADAVSMYTNIDTDHALETLKQWLHLHRYALPSGFPTTLILKALNLVMRNNVFQFDDTYWLQLTGTAMGTSVACMFATIYYAYHEATQFLRMFLHREPTPQEALSTADTILTKPILLYARLIDDTFQIWDLDLLPGGITAHNLTDTISSHMKFGILEWDVEPPTRQANFLDLTITLEQDGSITTSTYVKPMNLHLYIPPHSAHSKGVLKSLIFGNVQRYYYQNTHISTFKQTTRDFFQHLLNRGYTKETLMPLFTDVAKSIDERNKKLSIDNGAGSRPRNHHSKGRQLFLHWEFHPTDIRRQQIQQVYRDTLGPVLEKEIGVEKLTIAYSNPPNLRRCLTKTQLEEPDGERVSTLVEQLKQPSANL